MFGFPFSLSQGQVANTLASAFADVPELVLKMWNYKEETGDTIPGEWSFRDVGLIVGAVLILPSIAAYALLGSKAANWLLVRGISAFERSVKVMSGWWGRHVALSRRMPTDRTRYFTVSTKKPDSAPFLAVTDVTPGATPVITAVLSPVLRTRARPGVSAVHVTGSFPLQPASRCAVTFIESPTAKGTALCGTTL